MANDVIRLKFGVLGGASLNGESGAEIAKDLNAIASSIKPKIKFIVDSDDIQKQIKKLNNSFKINIGSSGGKSGNSGVKKDLTEYKNLMYILNQITARKRELNKAELDGNKELQSLLRGEISSLEKAYNSRIKSKNITKEELTLIRQRQNQLQYETEHIRKSAEAKKQDTNTQNLQYQKLIANATQLLSRNNDLVRSNSDAAKTAEELRNKMLNSMPTGDILESKQRLDELKIAIAKADKEFGNLAIQAANLGQKLKETFTNKLIQTFSYALIGILTRAIRQVYDNVVRLDKAVTNLQVAMGGNRDEAERLIHSYASLAKQLGATVLEVAEAADTFLRQGLSVSETNLLIANTLKLSKLGQLDSAEAAQALTSAMKGYKVEVQNTIRIVDKLTAVDMEAAASAGGIATAMAETATGANIAGVSMDKLIGYIATVKEVTQDSDESVGTFFKTLFARMGNVKAGKFVDDETGESLNDTEAVLNSLGIQTRTQSGLFRDFGDILDDVAAKWENYNNIQQHAIATAMAGTRQQEKLFTLLSNYDKAEKYESVAANSEGTADQKFNDAYMNSIEAKINTLTATWQEFSNNILNSAVVKTLVDILNAIVNFLGYIINDATILSVLIPVVVNALGKIGIKGTKSLLLFAKGLKNSNKLLKEAQANAKRATASFDGFVKSNNKLKNFNGNLRDIVDQSYATGDSMEYISKQTGISKKAAAELIAKRKEEIIATEQLQATQQAQVQNFQMGATIAMTLLTMITSLTDGLGAQAKGWISILVAVAAGIGLVFAVIKLGLFKARDAAIQLGIAEKTSIILTMISVILTIIMLVVKGIMSLVNADAEAKNKAKENAEAAQEEADALREVSDAAKEAADSIHSLTEEVSNLIEKEGLSSADWYKELEKIGEEVGNLFANEEMSSLQAINKLLGENYTYAELMRMSDQERLDLLEKINKASIEQAAITQSDTYISQKAASTSTVQAAGMRERIKTKGGYVVDEFEDIYAGLSSDVKNNVHLSNTGGKNFKVEVEAENAKQFVDRVESITKAYEEKYKYNLAALQENEVYQYFSGLLNTGKEALATQTNDALNYIESKTNLAGVGIKVNLDSDNLEGEYNKLRDGIIENLKADDTINVMITEGIIKDSDLLSMAEGFIAQNYSDLYNTINKQAKSVIIQLKTMVDMLEETEDAFDLLSDAMEEMTDAGQLSSDTIQKLLNDFPELKDYLIETAEGYKLADNALTDFIQTTSGNYIQELQDAQAYFDQLLAEYNQKVAAGTNTVEDYEKVIEAQESVANGMENILNWQRTAATLVKDSLMEQYTEILEKQTEALETQADKYKELCDIRRDLLSSYQDELNYQKELNQKTTAVADLESQLAVSRLDTSASGKKKTKDLESQLKTAKDELDEFTLEHAVDELTSRIDSSETEYENFIDAEIKEIEAHMESMAHLTAEEISNAIKGEGEEPTINHIINNQDTYDKTMSDATTAINTTIAEAVKAKEEEKNQAPKSSGKVSSGVSIGGGLSGLSDNARHNDDVDVNIGGKNFDLLAGSVADATIVPQLNRINGGANKAGDVVAYDGKLYIFDKKGDWRKMADDWDSANSAAAAYLNLLNAETHHTGGFVGDLTKLKSNEQFAKLLKGEFVTTPAQMEKFMKETLPMIATGDYGGSGGNIFNEPLIKIECGQVTQETLPELRSAVNEAVAQVKKELSGALKRTGYRGNANKFST